ncbi:CmcI family methyltransferase [Pseudoalteromonas umbrosa]|uniref:CmcI family methyltransferase n=1 Tax=Pseudoalteromonas umbrosa TaxID=3048489 RepID=UPI0024C4610E|nr:CmcI family methyltransferase [Pseudoalteromonas sp. B95]MDK1288225.1 CmcI family methyltransferase [Pseudoalteromonas sp. B95]
MNNKLDQDFKELNDYRGLGDNPVYVPPVLKDRPREWPLSKWAEAPESLGYCDFPVVQWRGVRLLKDPDTQSAYHNLLHEMKPKTIIELGVFSGGSLMWFRDLTKLMGLDCQVIGADKDLSRCQIPDSEMENITLHEVDCTKLETLQPLLEKVEHPVLFIDDAHRNTFNVMKWAVEGLLVKGDYFIIEDMIQSWHRYSPDLLEEYLAAFDDTLAMDMIFSNTCQQLEKGVFRRL